MPSFWAASNRRAIINGLLDLTERRIAIITAIVVVLMCAPFWALRHIPTQDGPAHMNSSAILAWYGSVPEFQQYFRIHWNPAGNLLSQAMCALFIRLFDPAAAEPLILTIYLMLFPLAVWFAVKPVSQFPSAFALASLPFANNYFLHMGFWNFYYGAILFFVGIGVYLRWRGWTRFAILTAVCTIAFLFHVTALAALVVVTAGFGVIEGLRMRRDAWKPAAVAVAAALPAAAMFLSWLIHSGHAANAVVQNPSLWMRVQALFGMTFIAAYGNRDGPLLALMTLTFGCLLVLKIRARRKDFALLPADALLFAAVLFALLGIAAPDHVGDSDYVLVRLHFFAWICVFLWLSAQSWTVRGRALVCATAVLFSGAELVARYPAYRYWSRQIDQFDQLGSMIPKDVVYTSINLDRSSPLISPVLHAADSFALKPAVNLSLYQAWTSHFSVSYREAAHQARPEFILVQAPLDGAFSWTDAEPRFAGRIRGYWLAGEAAEGRLRLYRTTAR